METKQIIKGNQLIAGFMGFYRKKGVNYFFSFDEKENMETEHRTMPVDGLDYHRSWSKLMPVVDKISNTGYFRISFSSALKTSCSVVVGKLIKPDAHIKTNGEGIAPVWEAAVEFIKWYNSTPNPEGSDTTGDTSRGEP